MNRYNNIPAVLTAKQNWVVWGVVGEPLKSPFQPESLLRLSIIPAKSGVPGTWGTFEAAEGCVKRGLASGIGYEFTGQGIYGVDLDHVMSDSGGITPQAREIVEGLASYTEISPSGHGLHIFITADNVNITRHRKQGGFVEIYTNARYFTVTGNIYGGFDRIADRSAELQRIHDSYFQLTVKPNFSTVNSQLSSVNCIRRGLEKDPVLRACWNGEHRRGDESASDQALMNKLAYWCNANQQAMIAAFLQSPYYAQKDDPHMRKCQRSDYLPNTAKAACATLRSTALEDTERYKQKNRERNGAR
jgi:putative DNA primase/helicase